MVQVLEVKHSMSITVKKKKVNNTKEQSKIFFWMNVTNFLLYHSKTAPFHAVFNILNTATSHGCWIVIELWCIEIWIPRSFEHKFIKLKIRNMAFMVLQRENEWHNKTFQSVDSLSFKSPWYVQTLSLLFQMDYNSYWVATV